MTAVPPGLWDAVRDRPDDDGARAVLADALLEAGDPQGELIAVQLAIARGGASEAVREREGELLAQVKGALGALAPAVRGLTVVRGLIETIDLDGKLREVGELVRTPRLAGLRGLSIAGLLRSQVPPVLDALRGPLASVTSLHLRRMNRDDRIVPALAALPLQRLSLTACSLEDDEAVALAGSVPAGIVELRLGFNHIAARGAEAIARASRLDRLAVLGLEQCDLGVDGGGRFAAGLALPALTELDLGWCDLGASMVAIAAAPALASLRWLEVSGNAIGNAGFLALARLAALEVLLAANNRIDDDAILELVRTPEVWPAMTRLRLTNNELYDRAIDALSESPLWTRIPGLEL